MTYVFQDIQSSCFTQGALHVAARLLAASILRRCPGAQIVKIGIESYAFSCTFFLHEGFSSTLFPFIEETVRELLRKKDIRVLEMVRDNAIEFLKFLKCRQGVEELKKRPKALVCLLKIDSYADPLTEKIDLEEAISSLNAFRLLELKHSQDTTDRGIKRDVFCIRGVCASDNRMLKNLINQAKEWQNSQRSLGSHFFVMDGKMWFWSPEGLVHKRRLEAWLRKGLTQMGAVEIGCLGSTESFLKTIFKKYDCFFSVQEVNSVSPFEDRYPVERSSFFDFFYQGHPHKIQDKVIEIKNWIDCLAQLLVLELDNQEEFFRNDGLVEKERFLYAKDFFDCRWQIASLSQGRVNDNIYIKFSLVGIERWFAFLIQPKELSFLREF